MKKIFKKIVDILFIIILLILGIYFILRLSGIAEIYKVKTGSMEDGIHTGDYILIYKNKTYNIGDIVTFKKDGYHVTHRIIKKNGDKVITKGDANNTPDDEFDASNIVGKVVYHGGLLNIIIDYKYIIAGGLLSLYLLSMYFDDKNNEEKENESDNEEEKSTVIEENTEKEEKRKRGRKKEKEKK